MNVQLVESIYQVIQSLSEQEKSLLKQKLFADIPYPSSKELNNLSELGNVFTFLNNEPNIYSIEDGESIEWQ